MRVLENMDTNSNAPSNSLYRQRVEAKTSIAQVFIDSVYRQPSSPAVVDNHLIISYEDLHSSALRLASQLHRYEYPPEEPTGVLVNPGIWNVITQLAVVYAGGTIVPVHPDESNEKMQSKLNNVGVRYLLVDEPNHSRLPMFECIVLFKWNTLSSAAGWNELDRQIPVKTALDHRTHILFTSGTTGLPKGVQISALSLLHITHHFPTGPLEPSDVVAHYIPTTFDYTLLEIWAPLFVGARITILPYADAFDGKTLAATLRQHRVTVMIIVTALLDLVSYTHPSAFEDLRIVLFGGDAASSQTISRILQNGSPPGRLINAYGPTETTCYSLTQELSMADTFHDPVSIGTPTGDTLIYILDDEMRPVPDGQAGELFIGGPGVSKGYIPNLETDMNCFLDTKKLSASCSISRLYCTGDIVRRDLASQQVYYLGRRDHQVTIFTMRVELAAVKIALMKTGRFLDAVAMAIDSPVQGLGKILVAFVIPVGDLPKHKVLDNIAHALEQHLPCPMPHFEVMDRFPLNTHFKVDRAALRKRYLQSWSSHLQKSEDPTRTTEQKLAHLWRGVLAMPTTTFTGGDNFFRLCRSEFQGAYLVQQIQLAFGVRLSLKDLQRNATLDMMGGLIDKNTVV